MIKNSGAFFNKTVFVTGGSRGIGKAIVLKMAQDGANVIIAAKTTEPHPKLEGTIYTAAKEVENAGGKCLPVQCDLRDEEAIIRAIDQGVKKFGTIDILINNASAISLTGTEDTTMKKYDLMNQINTRGTFMASKYCLPHLKNSSNPHILILSPPLEMKPMWFERHLAYTISKYGMSMCVLGLSEEYKAQGVAVNSLWPRTAIWTAAMKMLSQVEMAKMCRKVDIMADSAYAILSKDSKTCTGNFFIDEEVLRKEGITDFEPYAIEPGNKLLRDFFIPDHLTKGLIGLTDDPEDFISQPLSPEYSEKINIILERARSEITNEIKNAINAQVLIIVSGRNFFCDVRSSHPLRIEEVNNIPQCDVTFITNEDTFIKMAKGEIKPARALMSGNLKIKGNVSLAKKAEKLFAAVQNKNL